MISFAMEKENNQKIFFLDTLVSRNNGFIVIDVFRKPTHTNRYMDLNSHHEKKHKTSVAKAMKVLRKLGCCLQIEVILFGQVPEIVE